MDSDRVVVIFLERGVVGDGSLRVQFLDVRDLVGVCRGGGHERFAVSGCGLGCQFVQFAMVEVTREVHSFWT